MSCLRRDSRISSRQQRDRRLLRHGGARPDLWNRNHGLRHHGLLGRPARHGYRQAGRRRRAEQPVPRGHRFRHPGHERRERVRARRRHAGHREQSRRLRGPKDWRSAELRRCRTDGRPLRARRTTRPAWRREPNVSIVFSEPVDVTGTWFTISCTTSGAKRRRFRAARPPSRSIRLRTSPRARPAP